MTTRSSNLKYQNGTYAPWPASHNTLPSATTRSPVPFSTLGWYHHVITNVRKWELAYTLPRLQQVLIPASRFLALIPGDF